MLLSFLTSLPIRHCSDGSASAKFLVPPLRPIEMPSTPSHPLYEPIFSSHAFNQPVQPQKARFVPLSDLLTAQTIRNCGQHAIYISPTNSTWI